MDAKFMENPSKIEGPIFIGRGWKEYLKFFNLEEQQLKIIKILDCAAGASSFTAYMNMKGFNVTAVDILYDQKCSFLFLRCKVHTNALMDALTPMEGHFVWSFFKDITDLKKQRLSACEDFSKDYRENKCQNYIKADLTNLPFKDDSYNLVLCSHLLFIYDHRLDYDFHINSIKEMLRVTSDEVRIYPLIKHHNKKSPFLKRVIDDLHHIEIEILKVDYEFRKGADEMMLLKKI